MIVINQDIESSFRNVINSIENVFKTKLEEFDNITNDTIQTNCDLFYNLLEDDILYLLFLNNKIKVFSSKEEDTQKLSNSLFGNKLLLKNIFNNQDEMNKLILWDSLLHLYNVIELNNKNRNERLEELNDKFKQIKIKLSEHVKDQFLPKDVNNTTNNLVNDIIGSFQNLVSDNKNPFENIMGITTKISEKYFKDIENGNIEVDKLLKNMPIPGNKEGLNMENIMKNMMGGKNGDMMKNMGDMMGNMMDGENGDMVKNMGDMMGNMMGNMMDGENGDMVKNMMGGENGDMMKNMGDMMGNMMGGEMGDMMKNITGGKKEEKTTIIDDNFSTSDIEVGKDELEKKGKGMIGNVMNMAKNIPDMSGMPGLGEIGNMMKDMKNGDMNLGNLESMKGTMDNFMEKALGVNMDDFNKNMGNLVSNMEEKTQKEESDVNSID